MSPRLRGLPGEGAALRMCPALHDAPKTKSPRPNHCDLAHGAHTVVIASKNYADFMWVTCFDDARVNQFTYSGMLGMLGCDVDSMGSKSWKPALGVPPRTAMRGGMPSAESRGCAPITLHLAARRGAGAGRWALDQGKAFTFAHRVPDDIDTVCCCGQISPACDITKVPLCVVVVAPKTFLADTFLRSRALPWKTPYFDHPSELN